MKDTPIPYDSVSESILDDKWDKLLLDYDNHLKGYIVHYKKALKGNHNSMAKYLYLKNKSDKACLLLKKGQQDGYLSKVQQQKVAKTQMKLIYAIYN